MNQNLSDITVVMDRSGSMASCQQEAQAGLNRMVDDQKKEDGDCNFTFIQFDDQYEVVHNGVPIADVSQLELHPRGMTALNDAIGKAVNTTGERLSNMEEADRPGLVTLIIVTDGGENASHEFTNDQIKSMLETQQKDYNWKVIFLGANQDAFAEGARRGLLPSSSANYAVNKTGAALDMMSAKMSGMRDATARGDVFECGQLSCYTDEERLELEAE
jgi:uncharacterized protein YegL